MPPAPPHHTLRIEVVDKAERWPAWDEDKATPPFQSSETLQVGGSCPHSQPMPPSGPVQLRLEVLLSPEVGMLTPTAGEPQVKGLEGRPGQGALPRTSRQGGTPGNEAQSPAKAPWGT